MGQMGQMDNGVNRAAKSGLVRYSTALPIMPINHSSWPELQGGWRLTRNGRGPGRGLSLTLDM